MFYSSLSLLINITYFNSRTRLYPTICCFGLLFLLQSHIFHLIRSSLSSLSLFLSPISLFSRILGHIEDLKHSAINQRMLWRTLELVSTGTQKGGKPIPHLLKTEKWERQTTVPEDVTADQRCELEIAPALEYEESHAHQSATGCLSCLGILTCRCCTCCRQSRPTISVVCRNKIERDLLVNMVEVTDTITEAAAAENMLKIGLYGMMHLYNDDPHSHSTFTLLGFEFKDISPDYTCTARHRLAPSWKMLEATFYRDGDYNNRPRYVTHSKNALAALNQRQSQQNREGSHYRGLGGPALEVHWDSSLGAWVMISQDEDSDAKDINCCCSLRSLFCCCCKRQEPYYYKLPHMYEIWEDVESLELARGLVQKRCIFDVPSTELVLHRLDRSKTKKKKNAKNKKDPFANFTERMVPQLQSNISLRFFCKLDAILKE